MICKGSRCSPVGGSFPSSSSGQFVSGSGSYGSSGSFGSSGNYQTGSIANCRHGENCNVGSSIYGSSSGGFGSSSSGSIANCRFGQNCNVGYNTGSSSFGSSGQYNPYGSNGQQVRLCFHFNCRWIPISLPSSRLDRLSTSLRKHKYKSKWVGVTD